MRLVARPLAVEEGWEILERPNTQSATIAATLPNRQAGNIQRSLKFVTLLEG